MSSANLAVQVRNLSVRFGDFYAVKDVSFEVARGEIFGFLGANGAGKTTTIRVLCGLLAPTEGDVEVLGQKFHSLGAQLKMMVGYMSQKFTLYEDMTVAENLSFAGNLHYLSKKEIEIREQELLEFIGWHRPLTVMVRDLPGGQKQQVSLVAALMHDPELIFLDEPTAGVSPASRARFWELIQKLSALGKTVFVTTHYMDEAEQCGRIALMRAGTLVALDSPAELKRKTFPYGLLELEPHVDLSQVEIEEIKKKGLFSLFEPHGLRYHAEIFGGKLGSNDQSWLNTKMIIREIDPSLEDVFIRIVEGMNR